MMKRFWTLLVGVLLAVFLLSGCKKQMAEGDFYIYFKNKNVYELTPVAAVIEDGDIQAVTDTLYAHLKSGGRESSYASPVPSQAVLLENTLDGHNLIFNFAGSYLEIPEKEEILFRAALVKTFTQLEKVYTVEIRVEDQPLTLKNGTVVGPARGSHFVNVMSVGINEYEEMSLVFYGASPEMDGLVPMTATFRYAYGTPAEWVVMRNMMEGVGVDTIRPVFPPDTRLLSVSTNNGTCVVDFNEAFLEGREGVPPELTVYAIVNTLTSMKGVSAVQITINGSTQNVFMDQVDLSQPLQRNLDYVKK